jgi:hypothetical protein
MRFYVVIIIGVVVVVVAVVVISISICILHEAVTEKGLGSRWTWLSIMT